MKKVLLLLTGIVLFCSCQNRESGQEKRSAETTPTGITEVIYFHGKQRCVTCNAIEQLSKEVVDSLARKDITIRVVDITQKENEPLVNKYEVTWSSLIVNRDGTSKNLTEMGFRYAKSKPALFKAELTEIILQLTR